MHLAAKFISRAMKSPEPRILTLHPEGKQGVNLLKAKYDPIKSFILDTLAQQGDTTFKELGTLASETLNDRYDGKVLWYLTTVKLDLEARQLIERVPRSSPQRLRLVKQEE